MDTIIYICYADFFAVLVRVQISPCLLYTSISSGAIAYDVICPSDYMIQRMIENDLLSEINFDNIPNLKNIGKQYLERSRQFDPENKYSVPYCWGTVGILYNKMMVDEPVDSWSILWDRCV